MRNDLRRRAFCALLLLTLGSCRAIQAPKTEVLVLGMIHGSHRTSEQYGLEELERILRAAEPDMVLTEIPPDRLEEAARQFAETGEITESRVRVFPEYTEVLFPLQAELGFEIVACAGWTREMATARRQKLEELRGTHPAKSERADEGWDWIDATLRLEGFADDPVKMHSGERYDEIVETGMIPYDVYFNDALGAGGWTHINDAHWAPCAAALTRVRGEGKRVVITFGAWHKGRLRAALAKREDCAEVDAGALVAGALCATRS
ncbi:MAG: hypothetical protein ACJA0P_001581 [Planctomycetota bacterium]|jgi:hypothetical protein